jgi:hypothetical protein
MVSHELSGVAGSMFPEIFQTAPTEVAALAGVDRITNLVMTQREP